MYCCYFNLKNIQIKIKYKKKLSIEKEIYWLKGAKNPIKIT